MALWHGGKGGEKGSNLPLRGIVGMADFAIKFAQSKKSRSVCHCRKAVR